MSEQADAEFVLSMMDTAYKNGCCQDFHFCEAYEVVKRMAKQSTVTQEETMQSITLHGIKLEYAILPESEGGNEFFLTELEDAEEFGQWMWDTGGAENIRHVLIEEATKKGLVEREV